MSSTSRDSSENCMQGSFPCSARWPKIQSWVATIRSGNISGNHIPGKASVDRIIVNNQTTNAVVIISTFIQQTSANTTCSSARYCPIFCTVGIHHLIVYTACENPLEYVPIKVQKLPRPCPILNHRPPMEVHPLLGWRRARLVVERAASDAQHGLGWRTRCIRKSYRIRPIPRKSLRNGRFHRTVIENDNSVKSAMLP